ncbi:MAG: MBL fold metallo-hydrolase [Gaiellaceae bacterium]
MPTSRPTRIGSAIDELRPGLHRWITPHPDWEPDAEPDGPADWPQRVGSVLYEAGETVVLIDPLVTAWEQLDELLAGRPVAVVTTVHWHRRSRAEVRARYRAAEPVKVELLEIPGAGETIVWIPEHRALVPGDRLIGSESGRIRVCPPAWLGYLDTGLTHDRLREELRVLDPAELVLVSHGEPVVAGGRAALESALMFSSS